MIDGLKPYPAYKDSGVPWLGEVPEHWEIERLKSSVVNVIEQTPEWENGDLYVALEHVESWTGRLWSAGLDVTFDSQVKRFRLGDVLFGKLRPYLAKVTRPACDGVCVGEFFVLRSRSSSLFGPYLEYLLRSKPIIDAINSSTFGAKMPRADWQFVGNLRLSFPPLPEQSAIVRFLDHADRRIRRYIRAKQELIKLLNEQKQAIIHRAVTRGLDRNVHLKSSGVEWLGDVPEHWELRLLHHLLHPTIPLAYGILLPGPRLEEGVPYLGAGDVRPDRLRLDALPRTTSEIAAAYPRTRMRAGELVYAIRGSFGNVEVIPSELDGVNLSRDAARLAPCNDIDAFWLAFILRSRFCQEQFKLKEIGATITGVNIRDLKRIVLPVPPREEQGVLARFLDQETSATDGVIGRAHREISLLREYRTRLMADVVTGKLDVREAAARLPDEADEPEALQDTDTLTEGDTDTDEVDLDAVPAEAEA